MAKKEENQQAPLPNFIIAGFMKSGTTSLYAQLSRIPEIHMSTPKELHYFNRDDYAEKASLEWYQQHFRKNKFNGTAPQQYGKTHLADYSAVPERIKKIIPDAHIVFLLRNPIDRFISHLAERELHHFDNYNLHSYLSNLTPSELEKEHVVQTGMYFKHLEQYNRYFAGKIHIITSNYYFRNSTAALNDLLGHFDFNIEGGIVREERENQSTKRTILSDPWRSALYFPCRLTNSSRIRSYCRSFEQRLLKMPIIPNKKQVKVNLDRPLHDILKMIYKEDYRNGLKFKYNVIGNLKEEYSEILN